MTEEFNLSEKILWHNKLGELMSLLPDDILLKSDVKEFIRLLKEEFDYLRVSIEDADNRHLLDEFEREINNLVGDKLTGEGK